MRPHEAVRDADSADHRHNRLHHSRVAAQAQAEEAEGDRGGSESSAGGGEPSRRNGRREG